MDQQTNGSALDTGGPNTTLMWILGGLVIVIAVVALIVAVSAKNSSVDESQVVKDTKAQLKGELAGLGGAIKASKAASIAANRQAAHDRLRIKREVNLAVTGGEKQLDSLSHEANELQSQILTLQKQNRSLRSEVAELKTGQEELEAEVTKLGRRVRSLEG